VSEPTRPISSPRPAASGRTPVRERVGLTDAAHAGLLELEARYREAVELGFLGPRELERLRERHLDDALGLAVLRRPRRGERWVDLGSGAGLPGLPLASVFKDTHFTLVDAHQRRLVWAEGTASALGLDNVEVVHARLETYGHGSERGRFDVAVARALAASAVVLELGLPLLKVGGLLLASRGQLSRGERALLARVARQLGGGRPRVVRNVAAPVDPPGAVIMITKTAATPERFPRRPGLPQRQPLT
jgi:16S rRNA (guanine527-N7)-methyltransferase